MKKLSRSLHRTLMLLNREEEQLKQKPYSFGFTVKSPVIHSKNKKRLYKRGFLVWEHRRIGGITWLLQLWISEKGRKYIEEKS